MTYLKRRKEMKHLKVTSNIEENGTVTIYIEIFGRRYVWKNDTYVGWYKA